MQGALDRRQNEIGKGVICKVVFRYAGFGSSMVRESEKQTEGRRAQELTRTVPTPARFWRLAAMDTSPRHYSSSNTSSTRHIVACSSITVERALPLVPFHISHISDIFLGPQILQV